MVVIFRLGWQDVFALGRYRDRDKLLKAQQTGHLTRSVGFFSEKFAATSSSTMAKRGTGDTGLMCHRAIPVAKRLFIVAVLCFLAILFVDGPIARLFSESPLFHHHKKYAVGSAWFLIPLISAATFIAFSNGKGPFKAAKRLIILITICAVIAFLTNNLALKPLFGRTSIEEFLFWPSHYGFYFFRGNWHSNFPSGHMALLVAAITVLWLEFPRWRWVFTIVTGIAAFLLLFGEWHFVSDVIAGALWGNLVALTVIALMEKAQQKKHFMLFPRQGSDSGA